MKQKSEEIELSGEVLDKEKRKVTKYNATKYTSIPKKSLWDKFLKASILEIRLVRDKDGELVIVITRPKGDMP